MLRLIQNKEKKLFIYSIFCSLFINPFIFSEKARTLLKTLLDLVYKLIIENFIKNGLKRPVNRVRLRAVNGAR
jgi:hypothetical protein